MNPQETHSKVYRRKAQDTLEFSKADLRILQTQLIDGRNNPERSSLRKKINHIDISIFRCTKTQSKRYDPNIFGNMNKLCPLDVTNIFFYGLTEINPKFQLVRCKNNDTTSLYLLPHTHKI